jgi:beta-phosphoglucomutase family hydrolase
MLGLPDGVTACLFDMDGVVTKTSVVHDAAWKEMFDDFLREWSSRHGAQFVPFDAVRDYEEYVDGKPRLEGIRSFLASRSIELPEGADSDPAGTPTVYGLGNQKNALFVKVLERDGVEVYDGSHRYITAVRSAGLRTAIVSSSANTVAVLKAGGITDLFDARVDAQVAHERGLRGKPAPDTFLEAARMLGVEAGQGAVFEDALAGVAAGHDGRFGCVVGVDRLGQAQALRQHGADIVVQDLAELL